MTDVVVAAAVKPHERFSKKPAFALVTGPALVTTGELSPRGPVRRSMDQRWALGVQKAFAAEKSAFQDDSIVVQEEGCTDLEHREELIDDAASVIEEALARL